MSESDVCGCRWSGNRQSEVLMEMEDARVNEPLQNTGVVTLAV